MEDYVKSFGDILREKNIEHIESMKKSLYYDVERIKNFLLDQAAFGHKSADVKKLIKYSSKGYYKMLEEELRKLGGLRVSVNYEDNSSPILESFMVNWENYTTSR